MTTGTEKEAMSAEEKFFGLNAMVQPDDGDDDLEIEAVDEAELEREPEAKKEKSKPKVHADDESADDDGDELDAEMEDYSERVQKRIKKLTWEKNEERRQREAALREREEALNFSRNLLQKNQQYEHLIHNGEAALIQNMRAAVDSKLAQFEREYRQAYEEGDTDAIIKAQREYFRAEAEKGQVDAYENDYKWRAQQYQAAAQAQQHYQQQPQPQVRQPGAKALAWAKENPWFGKDKVMTAAVYGKHEELVRDRGMDPSSDEYFEEIDREVRLRFPERFDEEPGQVAPASTHRKPKTVVAPAGRSTGAKSRKVKLTQTQLAVAKQLGLTPEQYARQTLIDEGNM